MKRFTEDLQRHEDSGRLGALLEQVVVDASLHARFVNTLSRMEYVGVRKMLKARHAEDLDEEGLQHVIEEASHALRLKRAALKLAPDRALLEDYSEGATLGGSAGEAYMQGVDRGCERELEALGLEERRRAELNYLLSSAVIEVRAEVFYPLYEQALRAAEAPFSVAAIQKDEARHLAEMEEALAAALPEHWEGLVRSALACEAGCFRAWLEAVEQSLQVAPAGAARS